MTKPSKELAIRKSRLTINAIYKNGQVLMKDKEVVADAKLYETSSDNLRAIIIRFIVEAGAAENILSALHTGDVEVLIQDIPSEI